MYKQYKILENDRQYLCLMCGRCCRVVTTSEPYEQILKEAKKGDKNSIDFLEIFEPFKSTQDAKKVDKEVVENIIDTLKSQGKSVDNLTFYTCRFLSGNTCTKYNDRKELCKVFPSPWAVAPPNCGFEGWQFVKRETHKQKVRKLKEDLLDMQVQLNKAKSNTKRKKIEKVLNKIEENLKLYANLGPIDW